MFVPDGRFDFRRCVPAIVTARIPFAFLVEGITSREIATRLLDDLFLDITSGGW